MKHKTRKTIITIFAVIAILGMVIGSFAGSLLTLM
jgi:hypothetical protein